MNHCFQMKGLGKKIGAGDGLDLVAGGNQRAQIAGQGGRVAGNVSQGGGGDPGQQCTGLRAEAGARRVYDNQIRD